MKKHYQFTINGTTAEGQTWEATGSVQCEFAEVMTFAMKETFDQLTKGRAVFGHPGLGCRGPYEFHRVLIERVVQ